MFCRVVGGAAAKAVDGDLYYLFEVTEVLKGAEALKKVPGAGTPFRFEAILASQKPDDSVYFARGEKYEDSAELDWGFASAVDDFVQRYYCVMAKPSAGDGKWVAALMRFLMVSDQEFEKYDAESLDRELLEVPFREIQAARDALPVATLRAEIASAERHSYRPDVCLRLLGACGMKDDLPLLKSLLYSQEDRFRERRGDVLACYLRLGGEAVLSEIEAAFFKPTKERKVDPWQTYLAFHGVRDVARSSEVISRERLIATYRLLLALPKVDNALVLELARLEDWNSTPRMVELSRTVGNSSPELWMRGALMNFFRRSPRPEAKARYAEWSKLDPSAAELYEGVATP